MLAQRWGDCRRKVQKAAQIQPATTFGRLYALPAGYPALVIPEERILARGTHNPLADAAVQARIAGELSNQPDPPRPTGDWDLIHGELITFADPARELPLLDHLESFSVGRLSLYQRVLTYARIEAECFPTWTYTMPIPPGGMRLRRG